MNLNLGLNQGLNLSQQLNLAPQLLNWLKLLQCPTITLTQMVQCELESNPALETDDGDASSETLSAPDESADDESPVAIAEKEVQEAPEDDLTEKLAFLSELEDQWRGDNAREQSLRSSTLREDRDRQQFILDSITANDSLHEHLIRQLAAGRLAEPDWPVAERLIGSLDDRGYLTCPLAEIAELEKVSLQQVEKILVQVQELDPPGIGARDLRECLLLQLDDSDPNQQLAAMLARDYLPALAEENFACIAQALHVEEPLVRAAAQLLSTLNPHPAASFSAPPTEYITPDIVIRKMNGSYAIDLKDDYLPRLRISASCRRLLAEKNLSADDRSYIRRKVRAATFLIQGISQRQETLRKVAKEIIRVQGDFLDQENGHLQPLTMAKVAAIIGVHETTISRALANKYVETPRGIFEMKHFFRSGYRRSDGTAVTPEAVKEVISKLINAESLRRPLTDLQIVEHLAAQGLNLARRTIAKYREELKIPASKDRKITLSCRKPAPVEARPAGTPHHNPVLDHRLGSLAVA